MKLDTLPVEILENIAQHLGHDLVNFYSTNKRLREIASYDLLWKPVCQQVLERIQYTGAPSSYRQWYLEQKVINQQVRTLLNEAVAEDQKQKCEEKMAQIVDYGVRARDYLLQVLDRQRPTVIAEGDDYSIHHHAYAKAALKFIRHQRAIEGLRGIASMPFKYEMEDLFTQLDSFHDEHLLNPTTNDIFQDLVQEISQIKVKGTIQQKAVTIATKLFRTDKSKNKAYSRNFLSAVLEDGADGNHLVNICIFAYIGKMYGLTVRPVLLQERERFCNPQFARVEDPSSRDGYFIINVVSQIVHSAQSLRELVAAQQTVRLFTTQPTLQQMAIAFATDKINRYELITEDVYNSTAVAKLACVSLFDDRPQTRKLANSDSRFTPLVGSEVDKVLEKGQIASFYLPEHLDTCETQGQVLQGIQGGYGLVLGYHPTRKQYKVVGENGLTWYMSEDEIKKKIRVYKPADQLLERGSSELYTEVAGQYFRRYDNETFTFC